MEKKKKKTVRFNDSVICQSLKGTLKEKLQKEMKCQRKRQLLDAVKQDEKEIKILEKRLKLNKRKNKTSRGFVQCGLDFILDVCDPDKVQSIVNNDINLDDSDSDFFEDISLVEGKNKSITTAEENYQIKSSSKLKTLPKSNELTKQELKVKSTLNCIHKGDINDIYLDSVESEGVLHNSLISKLQENESCAKNLQEDIYGRLRDPKGNVIKQNHDKYKPPQLRVFENSEISKAKKQLKGLLNRLAQSNISSIANEVENIYSKHSRNSINEAIIELTLSNLVTKTLTPQHLIIDHAMLVCILHANIGMEIGAYLLQMFVERFNFLLNQSHQIENKELDNILYLISYLYNFKLFEACLMYDILNKLCNDCTEKSIDLILVILKSVGFTLRKEDPNAMKQFLLTAQKRFNQLTTEENSRMKYMLSVLINIKNNNITKLSEFDPSHHEQLKKVLKGLIRKGNSIVALRITLDDLLNVEEHGRWWLVGSAWKNEKNLKTVHDKCYQEEYSAQLLELAKKQRMNTDNRRNIFCILMTAEDYQDAFEKVLRLGLKGQQEREIPLVIIHCLLQEKNYNPYYGLVVEQLCMSNRSHQMTLQCALWDKFRDLQSLTSFQINLLAQFLAQLLIAGSLPISVLKVVEFAELDKQHIRLLRQTILSVAKEDNLDSVKEIFVKVSKAKKLSLFREALNLFVHHFILRNMAEGYLHERLNIISTMLVDNGS